MVGLRLTALALLACVYVSIPLVLAYGLLPGGRRLAALLAFLLAATLAVSSFRAWRAMAAAL